MPALMPRATTVHDSARLHILEAYIETLKAENESFKRQLAVAEKRVARETAKAEGAIAEFSAITKRLTRVRPSALVVVEAGLADCRPQPGLYAIADRPELTKWPSVTHKRTKPERTGRIVEVDQMVVVSWKPRRGSAG